MKIYRSDITIWQRRRPQPPTPHKDKTLDSYSSTKTALGELWSLIRKLQQPNGIKIGSNCTKRKEEQPLFAFVILSPKPTLLSDSPARKSPSLGKRRQNKQSASPDLGGHLMKNLLQFHPSQRPAKLRHRQLGTRKKSRDYQDQPYNRSDHDSW